MKYLFDQLKTTEVLPKHNLAGISPLNMKSAIPEHANDCHCVDCDLIHNESASNKDCIGNCSWPKHCE